MSLAEAFGNAPPSPKSCHFSQNHSVLMWRFACTARSAETNTLNSGFYAACAGLRARTQALELIANNVANVSTNGYRAQQPVFHTVLAAQRQSLDALNRSINNFGVLEGSRVDLAPGSLERTGNPLDLAIEGKAFFAVQTRAGTFYTRNGNFQVSAQGQLTTSQGDLVLGEQAPVSVPGGTVSVSADGTLSVNGAVAGKLKLVEFAPDTSLVAMGNSYYSAAAGTERPAGKSYVRQGMLEDSNAGVIESPIALIMVQRQAEMLERALSAFHSEFNRTAAVDLPRL
jgi:flagellar basal-body rod protein FlgF